MDSVVEEREKERVATLQKTELFNNIGATDLSLLARQAREIKLRAGELLFSAEEPSQGLYLVLSGKTRAFRHGSDGREQVMHEDLPGSTFPEVAVFDSGPYPSSVIAVEPSRLLFFPKKAVIDFCIQHPEVALSALKLLSGRLRRATGMVEGLVLRGVSQRLAEYLLDLLPDPESREFELPHSNQEIADLIGTVREVVSRTFARLQKNGWIEKNGRAIRVLDAESLKQHFWGER